MNYWLREKSKMKKTLLLLLSIPCLLFAGNISPEMQKQFDATHSQINSINSAIKNSSGYKGFDINEYTKDPSQLKNPEQTKYYKNEKAMDVAKNNTFATDNNVSGIKSAFINEPEIDGKSEMNQRLLRIKKNAEAITNGKSTQDYQCVENPTDCHTVTEEKQCHKVIQHDFDCTETADVTFKDDTVRENKITYLNNTVMPINGSGNAVINVDPETISISYAKVHFHKTHGYHCDTTYTASLNGKQFGQQFRQKCNSEQRSHHKWIDDIEFSESYSDMPIQNGQISFTLAGGGAVGVVTGQVNNKTEHKDIKTIVNWINSCGKEITNCPRVKKQCIEGAATKTIDGHDVHLDCWKYADVYECGDKSEDTCSAMHSCDVISSKCTLQIGEFCILQDYKMECTTKSCDSKEIKCGEPGFCTDGKCFSPDRADGQISNEGFAKTVAGFAAIADAADDVKKQDYTDEDEAKKKIRIEIGKGVSCSQDSIASLYDCCQMKKSIINQCSEDDRKLFEARKKGVAAKVGRYCSNKVLGICLEHKEGWCVFDSKLARIVQQQGKPLIGLNLGTGKHPNCEGFTLEQFESVPFGRIDFSEFMQDLIDKTKFPDKQDIINQAKKKIAGQ